VAPFRGETVSHGEKVMSRASVLRRQAETCLQLSYGCSDPVTADHLRMIAAEYFQSACDLEQDRPSFVERGLGQFGRGSSHNVAR
jgi:hypothetical protein